MSEPPSYPPPPQPPAQPAGLANLSPATLLWAQVGGSAVVLISIFLPWASVDTGFLGRISGNGFDYGPWGVLLLLLSLAVGALAFIEVRGIRISGLNLPPILPLVLSGVMALFALISLIVVMGDVSEANDLSGLGDLGDLGVSFDVGASSGIGVWLVLIAALVTFAAALVPYLKSRRPSA